MAKLKARLASKKAARGFVVRVGEIFITGFRYPGYERNAEGTPTSRRLPFVPGYRERLIARDCIAVLGRARRTSGLTANRPAKVEPAPK